MDHAHRQAYGERARAPELARSRVCGVRMDRAVLIVTRGEFGIMCHTDARVRVARISIYVVLFVSVGGNQPCATAHM